eukprot:CAMPEP_0116866100 /NCGR_PEP_ID=MMETSP0418-20121206/25832_1 /TAXON_ID=1158023 /ORGANISM="Astrosyne radiata, Strain 13vi08-1A" /LENGTH=200 /DNA_ID=CAMNT_0004501679 /DNA_START=28 /DNA_END=626 /DNA_ORIENTATION=-
MMIPLTTRCTAYKVQNNFKLLLKQQQDQPQLQPQQNVSSALTNNYSGQLSMDSGGGSEWSPNSEKPKKKVSFDDNILIVETLSLQDMSEMERRAVWYSDMEEQCHQIAAYSAVEEILASSLDCPDLHMRGLEGLTPHGRIRQEVHVGSSVSAVLDEQHRQRYEMESTNEVTIAEAYKQVTTMCQTAAEQRGQLDYEAATT